MFHIRRIITCFIFGTSFWGMVSCSKAPDENIQNPPVDTILSKLPVLTGKMVFHSYSCYSCNDSKLYLYDFKAQQLTFLSKYWNITNPMNAHFSPDGKKIVFMGMPSGSDNWDIFLYKLGSQANPDNLTLNSPGRDEDPKFSPDGSRIVFKRDGILKEMDTTGLVTRTFNYLSGEASMPYYTKDSNSLLYAASVTGSSTLDINILSIADGTHRTLYARTGIQSYYPIVRDDTSYLFTSWIEPANENDQVYLGFFDNRAAYRLAFNDPSSNYSDAYPADGNILILSSTRSGGNGAYDLYLADMKTGKLWSLNVYNAYINTVNNELGACYSNK